MGVVVGVWEGADFFFWHRRAGLFCRESLEEERMDPPASPVLSNTPPRTSIWGPHLLTDSTLLPPPPAKGTHPRHVPAD